MPTNKLSCVSVSGYIIPWRWRKTRSVFQLWCLSAGFHGGHSVHEDGSSETTEPDDHVQQERGDMPKGRTAVSHVPSWRYEGKVASDRHHDPDQTRTIPGDAGRRDVIAACHVFESEQIEINRLRVNTCCYRAKTKYWAVSFHLRASLSPKQHFLVLLQQ